MLPCFAKVLKGRRSGDENKAQHHHPRWCLLLNGKHIYADHCLKMFEIHSPGCILFCCPFSRLMAQEPKEVLREEGLRCPDQAKGEEGEKGQGEEEGKG